MRTAGHWHEAREGWTHFGRAAERFARRVARDAQRFAKDVEAHVGELAHEVRREWHCMGREGAGDSEKRGAEMRKVFDDVRGVLAAVIDGIDELVSDMWSRTAEADWTRVVCNRDATCSACARPVAAGAEAWVRQRPGGLEFRCVDCGKPNQEQQPGA
jgi:hypothetical protein